MVETIIWTPIERLLSASLIMICLFGAICYFLKASQRENPNDKRLLNAFGYSIFCGFIAYVCYFLAEFYHVGIYTGINYIGIIDQTRSPAFEFYLVGHLAYSFQGLLLVFQIERLLKKTRFLLSLFILIGIFLSIISFTSTPPNTGLFGIASLFIWVIVFSVLIWMHSVSKSEFQNLSIFFIIGYIIILLAALMDQQSIVESGIIAIELMSVVNIIGYLCICTPAFINVEKLLKTNRKGLITSLMLLIIALDIIFFILLTPIYNIVFGPMGIIIFGMILLCITIGIILGVVLLLKRHRKEELTYNSTDQVRNISGNQKRKDLSMRSFVLRK